MRNLALSFDNEVRGRDLEQTPRAISTVTYSTSASVGKCARACPTLPFVRGKEAGQVQASVPEKP